MKQFKPVALPRPSDVRAGTVLESSKSGTLVVLHICATRFAAALRSLACRSNVN